MGWTGERKQLERKTGRYRNRNRGRNKKVGRIGEGGEGYRGKIRIGEGGEGGSVPASHALPFPSSSSHPSLPLPLLACLLVVHSARVVLVGLHEVARVLLNLLALSWGDGRGGRVR